MMPGSCRLDSEYFIKNASTLCQIAIACTLATNVQLHFLDLGGGIGIPYSDREVEIDLVKTFKEVHHEVTRQFIASRMKVPTIAMEPGRYFVGDAGILIGRVQAIKNSVNVIIGTDLSMNVMARTVLYNADHRIEINQKINDETLRAGMCGQVCENTDYAVRARRFPSTVERGDIVVMYDVGAYGYSMAYDYNGRVTPAEVLVDRKEHTLIRRRKSYSDTLVLVEGGKWRKQLDAQIIESIERNGVQF